MTMTSHTRPHTRPALDGHPSTGELVNRATEQLSRRAHAAGRAVGQFLGGVPHDADDPAGPPGVVAADIALGVGPARGAVAAADTEVGAVVLAALLDDLGDEGVEPGRLGLRHPQDQGSGASVELLGQQVEDLVRLGVHVEQALVQVPVEGAHVVERQNRVRVGGPVLRE